MNADRKAQVIAKYARITRENHQLRIENQHLRERHLELEDQLLASRNRKWKDRAVSLEAELHAVRCELRDAKASIALSDKLLRGARDRRDLWEHRYWTIRDQIEARAVAKEPVVLLLGEIERILTVDKRGDDPHLSFVRNSLMAILHPRPRRKVTLEAGMVETS